MTTNLDAQWIVGFVDGEGCFHISINQHKEMKHGFQVLPEFTVVQHESDIQILHALKDYWGCGVVRKNHGDRQCYRVRAHTNLMEVIIPFFEKHKLKTKKRIAFQRFRTAVLLMERGEHLTPEGLTKFEKLREGINNQ